MSEVPVTDVHSSAAYFPISYMQQGAFLRHLLLLVLCWFHQSLLGFIPCPLQWFSFSWTGVNMFSSKYVSLTKFSWRSIPVPINHLLTWCLKLSRISICFVLVNTCLSVFCFVFSFFCYLSDLKIYSGFKWPSKELITIK